MSFDITTITFVLPYVTMNAFSFAFYMVSALLIGAMLPSLVRMSIAAFRYADKQDKAYKQKQVDAMLDSIYEREGE
jgi:hypothetical protein